MLKRFLIFAVMALASCQSLALSNGPEQQASAEATAVADAWMETEMNGVRLGVRMPPGWDAAHNAEYGGRPEGLMLVEYRPDADTGELEVGALVYLFVPPLDNFRIPEDSGENAALAVLDQVVEMPSHIGDDAVASDPVPFEWDGRDAAYYLLTSANAAKTIVLAVETKSERRLVVCNINMPASETVRVREMLPTILDGMMIDGEVLDGQGLEVLPDPLVFPANAESPEATLSVVQ